MAEQVNLFGHSIKPKRTQLEAVETNKNESFEERKAIGWLENEEGENNADIKKN